MDPEILDVLGKEIEIKAWRGTDNLYEALLTDADGVPVPLGESTVILTIVDRAGGTVKYQQVNEPEDHTDAGAGLTRFNVPRTPTFDGLTGQRSFTWKYQVVRVHLPTGKPNIYFYGDYRVMPPYAEPMPPP